MISCDRGELLTCELRSDPEGLSGGGLVEGEVDFGVATDSENEGPEEWDE